MSCVIIYKGRKYSEEQFKEYFINNKQEFVTSIAKNKNVIDSFKRKMEGIDFVFSQSPELAAIGSKAQYMQYLSTIFKTSKVKDIVYHGTRTKFDKFDKSFIGKTLMNYGFNGFGFYFDKHRKNAIQFMKVYRDWENKTVVVPAILNMTNPKLNKDFALTGEESNDKQKAINYAEKLQKEGNDGVYTEQHEEYVVFEPEQIHVLGGKNDIQGFKEFVQEEKDDLNPFIDESNKIGEQIRDVEDNIQFSLSPEINYQLKAIEILNSDKAKQVFEKGKKANWDLNKILTELQVPKEQKKLVENIYNNKINDILKTLEKNCG